MDLVQKKVKISDDADEADAPSEVAANVSESTRRVPHLGTEAVGLWKNLTACFVDINRPQTLDPQRAVISVLRVASLKIQPSDSLLDWLAHYAAYTVDQLQHHPSFHDLLEAAPALCSSMMNRLRPASAAPWQSQTSKHRFPPYKPGSYEEQCE
ncbi:hypothetical protein Asppvi_000764 [Aspergillus pseudoviridinutans]|uniref:Uncharacterized protein n=1 Tax=Aspergillus pseudoviridinutans TaxID=1517512 RepID=A0A9P3B3X9_9EURO|nr:uncharacterized protein Asppvi_000764 [Aspergillus pseudoviridinutans]GIJ82258.1 hypothetical protein Asppvi_000764 [Aspergillus pseudoviridinutans]